MEKRKQKRGTNILQIISERETSVSEKVNNPARIQQQTKKRGTFKEIPSEQNTTQGWTSSSEDTTNSFRRRILHKYRKTTLAPRREVNCSSSQKRKRHFLKVASYFHKKKERESTIGDISG